MTKIWHPNISSVTGAICLDILKDQWAAAMTLRTVLLSLQALLAAPEPDDPQDAVVARQYRLFFVRSTNFVTNYLTQNMTTDLFYALFFFRFKIILDWYKLFLDTFGPIQNGLEPSKIIWTRLKQFGRSKIVLCFD